MTAGSPAAGHRGLLFGVPLEIAGPADLVASLAAEPPYGWRAPSRADIRPDQTWRLAPTPSGVEVWRGPSWLASWPADLLAPAVWADVVLWAAAHTPRWVVVHAGVIGWRGRGLLLPGRSGAGKSTLVAALVALGADYYSDEYALLAADGRASAYPRPIATPPECAQPRHGQPKPPTRRLDVNLIAALTYLPGAVTELSALSPGAGALILLGNAVAARTRPRAVLGAVTAAATRAQGVRGNRGEATEAATQLVARLDGGS
ncbi:MAG TPA: hypothetical protein VNG13_00880 [Mycobacteriales bacterium]|nr:hypothetical protein [Mycobacteriales bacterium]